MTRRRNEWLPPVLLIVFLVFVLPIGEASPVVAADRPGNQASRPCAAAAVSPAPPMTPVAATTEAHAAYPYRPYCDPHSDSYTPRYCHASCASWWCDLYWDDQR